MNIQERIEALESEFNERLKALKEEVQQEQEFPQNNDKYWYIDDEGEVFGTFYDNHYIDRYHQEIGNIFQTKEQAEFAVEKLKVEAELRKFSQPFDYENRNWVILWNNFEKNIQIKWSAGMVRQGSIYIESKEKAEEAVKSVGEDRIKKYIFGVED